MRNVFVEGQNITLLKMLEVYQSLELVPGGSCWSRQLHRSCYYSCDPLKIVQTRGEADTVRILLSEIPTDEIHI